MIQVETSKAGTERSASSPPASDLRALLESNAVWHRDMPAVIEDDRVETWGQFGQTVRGLAANLARLGLGHGSRVSTLAGNSADMIALYWASAWLGAVFVPLNWRLTASELSYVLGLSRPDLIMVGEPYMETLQTALEDGDAAARPTVVAARGAAADLAELSWDEAFEVEAGEPPRNPIDWNDPHVIIFTSGTTGRPKGVVSSHRRTLIDHLHQGLAQDARPRERFLCYLPLFHAAAWAMQGPYLAWGGAVVITPAAEPQRILELLQRHRCTATFALPMILREMVELPAFADADLSSLRRIIYASFDGSSFMREAFDALRERGATELGMAHSYGLTEAGPAVTYLPPELWKDAPASVGFPPPGITVQLFDDEMNPVSRGERGEICLRSPTMMDGYLDDPEATAAAFAGGWLHTGDIGEVDEEGLLYVVDRKKDLIRTGAENVAPKEVEAVLIECRHVRECAVVGVPDERYEERIVACVALREEVSVEELDRHARRSLAGFKCPKDYVIVDEIPKTSVGKVAKNSVKELVLSRL